VALMWGANLQTKPKPYCNPYGFVIQPHATWRYGLSVQPVSVCCDDAARKAARWKGKLRLLSTWERSAWIPGRSQNGCLAGKVSGMSPKVWTKASGKLGSKNYQSWHSLKECPPGGRVCLQLMPNRRELQAKKHVPPPDLHPWQEDWLVATEHPISSS